jgi:hypothetical protein
MRTKVIGHFNKLQSQKTLHPADPLGPVRDGAKRRCGGSRGSEASADFADRHRFPAGGESLTEARRGNEHCPNLTLLHMILPSMILLLFPSAGGQSHIFTYAALFRKLYIQPNPLGQETAHSRLNLGSARRSNPTHFF